MALFPSFSITFLRRQHGQRWGQIVDEVNRQPLSSTYVMAFAYTLRRLRQAVGRASTCYDPRCAECALEVLSYFEGSEDELVARFHDNLKMMEARVENRALHQRRERVEETYALRRASTVAIA